MFGTVADGLKGLADAAGLNKEEEESQEVGTGAASSTSAGADAIAADLDAR